LFSYIYRRFVPLYENTHVSTVKIMVIYRTQGHSRLQKYRENNFFAKRDMTITMLKHSFTEITV